MNDERYVIVMALILFIVATIPVIIDGSLHVSLVDYNEYIPENLPWYFVFIFGDNRPSDINSITLPKVFYQFIELSEVSRPFATIGTGDHVGKGSIEQINQFILTTSKLSNFWVIEGNHDLGVLSEQDYWHTYVAPSMYYKDNIPDWRFVFFSTELPLSNWSVIKDFLNEAFNTNRSIVLVFHRPMYPYVNHNMNSNLKNMIEKIIFEKENLKCVFQGHWHGYSEAIVNGIPFVITGGAGAPLYQGTYHHFLVAILSHNGAISYYPVKIDDSLTVYGDNSKLIITNDLSDLDGESVSIPLRIKIEVNGIPVTIVGLFPPGTTIISYNYENGYAAFNSNRDFQWYSYVVIGNKALLGEGNSTFNKISLENLVPVERTITRIMTYTMTKNLFIQKTSTTTVTETILNNITLTSTSIQTLTETVTLGKYTRDKHVLLWYGFLIVLVTGVIIFTRKNRLL